MALRWCICVRLRQHAPPARQTSLTDEGASSKLNTRRHLRLPAIPIEIWWLVIDFLDGEYDTLLSCSMVCRARSDKCQELLPDFIVFTNRQDVARAGRQRAMRWRGPKRVQVARGPIAKRARSNSPFDHVRYDARGQVDHSKSMAIENATWRTDDMHSSVFLHLSG